MGLFVPDMIDNKTEAHVAISIRVAAFGIGVGSVLAGLGFIFWGLSKF